MKPIITIAIIRQPDLGEAARARLWHSVRTEILAALGCLAIAERHSSGGQLIGLSDLWEIVLTREPAVALFPRKCPSKSILALHANVALQALTDVVNRRRSLLANPVLTLG